MSRKKILITGKGSYIGTSFIKWVSQWPDQYEVEEISVRGEEWKNHDFSKYDVVLHVAGIAHIKETKANSHIYTEINRDLAFHIAQKAKKEGVKQFVFISSMSVFGVREGIIKRNSIPNPISKYGISKLQAEELIKTLEDSRFIIAIVRPPMVYGKGCKGNYNRLAKLALKLPIFPEFKNQRSMIFIENLTNFIRLLIDKYEKGIFLPQNEEYVSTSEMVKLIADFNSKKIKITKVFNPLLKLLSFTSDTFNKVFGNLTYEKNNSYYCVRSFTDSIRITEERC
ncbi:NAD-dependent epimerase/dehydratase family protein [Paenibacillus apii]|uniref:NAD-dependent epimerase/dehydratase family protein n=1 Tax=Paenibacillus apii TaxID=1850370 RepID=UPI001439B9C6|nr:NAD-dependent epimerase/dehydratase family protein [Paenibacillus apii]NJJ41637.1 NAD-dependent epimerase/dehydratase family protein [Paenibacillus apii]